MKLKNCVALVATLAVAILAMTRMLPHTANFTLFYAAIFFAVSRLSLGSKMARSLAMVGISVSSMLFSDLFLGLYDWRVMAFVYSTFVVTGLLALKFAGGCAGGFTPYVGLLINAVCFSLIADGATWMFSGMYPLTLGGLFSSYAAGFPFSMRVALTSLAGFAVMDAVWNLAPVVQRRLVGVRCSGL